MALPFMIPKFKVQTNGEYLGLCFSFSTYILIIFLWLSYFDHLVGPRSYKMRTENYYIKRLLQFALSITLFLCFHYLVSLIMPYVGLFTCYLKNFSLFSAGISSFKIQLVCHCFDETFPNSRNWSELHKKHFFLLSNLDWPYLRWVHFSEFLLNLSKIFSFSNT